MKRIIAGLAALILLVTLPIAAPAVLILLVTLPDERMPYVKTVASTVWIEAGEGSGTGVLVGETLILTAHHVVEGEPVVRAHFSMREGNGVASSPARYGPGMVCTVIASDPGRDLALLRTPTKGRPIALARDEPVPGDRLFAIGCGDGTSLFGFSSGHTRQVFPAELPRPNGIVLSRMIDMSVPVNLGDSGGPVVNASGKLVGIISHIDAFKNQTYLAISTSEIRTFLNSCPGR